MKKRPLTKCKGYYLSKKTTKVGLLAHRDVKMSDSFNSIYPKIKQSHIGLLCIFALINITLLLLGTLHIGGLDDAYITYQFSKNLAESGKIIWSLNDLAPIYGSTTFLYTLLLSLCHLIGLEIPITSVVLGALFWTLSNIIIYSIVKNNYGFYKALIVYIFLLPFSEHVYLSYGMETGLYTFLALLSFYLYSLDRISILSWVCVLLIMTRLDGILVPFIIFIHFFLSSSTLKTRDKFIYFLIKSRAALTFFLLWLAFLLFYFGSIFPNSYHAKSLFGDGVSGFFNIYFYLEIFKFEESPIIVSLFFLTIFFGLFFNLIKWKKRHSLMFLWVPFYIAMYAGKGMTASLWYYAPVLPVLISLFVLSLINIIAHIHTASLNNMYHQYITMPLASIAITFTSAQFFINEVSQTIYKIQNDFLGQITFNNEERKVMSDIILKDMAENGKKNTTIYSFEVGFFGYYIEGKVYDLLGLVTPEVVDNGGYQKYSVTLLEKYKTDYVVIVDAEHYEPVSKLLKSAIFRDNYTAIFILPRVYGHNYVIYKKNIELTHN